MKKLSKIGTHCKPDPDSTTQFEEHWIMTKDERRELVRQVWADCYSCIMSDNRDMNPVERYIKDEGI